MKKRTAAVMLTSLVTLAIMSLVLVEPAFAQTVGEATTMKWLFGDIKKGS